MPFSESELEWLRVLLENLDSVRGQLNEKSRAFVKDQVDRFEQYGQRMLLSPKQEQWLLSLHENHCADFELPDRHGNIRQDFRDEPGDDDIPF